MNNLRKYYREEPVGSWIDKIGPRSFDSVNHVYSDKVYEYVAANGYRGFGPVGSNPSSQTVLDYEIYEWRDGGQNSPFKRRHSAGEILTSHYSVGNHRVSYPNYQASETITTSYASWRWMDVSSELGIAPPLEGIQASPWLYPVQYRRSRSIDTSVVDYVQLPDLPAIDEAVLTSAAADLNGKEMDILTTVLESQKTAQYLIDRITDLAHVLAKAKKRPFAAFSLNRRKGSQDSLTSSSELWLEANYAIMPLILDIENILDVVRNVGLLYVDSTSSTVVPIQSETSSGPFKVTDQGNIVYRGWAKRSYDPANFVSSIERCVSYNPFVTGWELIPYSFVIDWFVNIGDNLALLAPPTIKGCEEALCTSVRFSNSRLYSQNGITRAIIKTESYRRVPYGKAPYSLSFKYDPSWANMLTSFALAWTSLKRSL